MGFAVRVLMLTVGLSIWALPAVAETVESSESSESSALWRRWRQGVPDVAQQMRDRPSFRTRVRAGYGEIADEGGWVVGVEDLRVGRSRLMLAGEVGRGGAFRSEYGEVRAYLRSLGSGWNVAPTVGYQAFDWDAGRVSGMALGGRLMVPLSRGGGADLAVGKRFVLGGGEVTTVGVGYAVTARMRVGTEFQRWRSGDFGETRGMVMVEWMP